MQDMKELAEMHWKHDLLGSIEVGIVVVDSVHFLSKFMHARRNKGLSPEDAVRYAFRTVGPALVTTSVILVIGFSVLAYSTFRINSEMGLMTALTIASALVFDFTVLPALLLLLGKRERKVSEDTPEDAAPALG